MVKFTAKEEAFLKSNEVCRLATASKDGRPQVTPVIYALDGAAFVVAVDYGTKKPGYIDAFFKNVNWPAAEARLK